MAQTSDRRRTGRPPRGVNRRQWNPSLTPALASALDERAKRSGVKAATYCELVVSMAHGYNSDRIEKLDVKLSMTLSSKELQRRTKSLSSATVLRGLTGGAPRPITVDEPLAEEIIARSSELGVTISDYIRTVYSEAVGRGVAGVHQGRLDVTVPKPVREEARLAS